MNKILKIILILIIGWGLYLDIALVFSFDKKYPEEAELVAVAEVVSSKIQKEKSNCYTVKILNSNLEKTQDTKIIVYTDKSCHLSYGDVIQISGTFSKGAKSRNYKGFSYRDYLKQSKIYGSVYVKNPQVLGHKKGVFEKIFVLKTKLYEVLDNLYKENENAFLKGILLGDSNELDDEIKENFKSSSMSHVLAISGMHVSYVMLGMQLILDKLVNSRKLKNYMMIGILGFFVVITGMAPSCLRACIMSVMMLVSQNFYRKNNFYITILFTFLLLLLMNPYHIFSVGMWLSFGGTLGIVLFHKFFKRFIECKFKIKSKFLKSFLGVFLVSFSAQILILPIMIYCFNTVSFTFFVSNLLIYFLVGPLLALGYMSLILGALLPPIGKFLAIFEQFLIFILFKIAEFCSTLPFSKMYVATPDFWQILLYYAGIVGLIYLFQTRKIKFLKFILGTGYKDFGKKYWKKVLICSSVIIFGFQFISLLPRNLRIYFVDVGQRRLRSYSNFPRKKFNHRWRE